MIYLAIAIAIGAFLIAFYNVESIGEFSVFCGLSICFLPVVYFCLPGGFYILFTALCSFIIGGILAIIKVRKEQTS